MIIGPTGNPKGPRAIWPPGSLVSKVSAHLGKRKGDRLLFSGRGTVSCLSTPGIAGLIDQVAVAYAIRHAPFPEPIPN